jgi:hypothetical protein
MFLLCRQKRLTFGPLVFFEISSSDNLFMFGLQSIVVL